MYRKFSINRETNLLATVFTLPQLIEDRVYLVVPPDARSWAESAGLAIPPANYDVIQAPPINPDVNITSPELFAEVSGNVTITWWFADGIGLVREHSSKGGSIFLDDAYGSDVEMNTELISYVK